jgi:hypothetical protein
VLLTGGLRKWGTAQICWGQTSDSFRACWVTHIACPHTRAHTREKETS